MTENWPSPQPAPPAPTPTPPGSPQLVRPIDGRRIGGVCAAIADRYGWSRTTVRLLAVLSILFPGPQILAYVIAWVVIPSETRTPVVANAAIG